MMQSLLRRVEHTGFLEDAKLLPDILEATFTWYASKCQDDEDTQWYDDVLCAPCSPFLSDVLESRVCVR